MPEEREERTEFHLLERGIDAFLCRLVAMGL